MNNTGTIEIEISSNGGGTPVAGTDFDQLAVSGQADLQGTLDLIGISGYNVTNGDSFTGITYATRTANFFSVINPINGGVLVTPTYGATQFDFQLDIFAGIFFDGGGDGSSWEDALNWSGNAEPLASNDVLVSGLCSYA